MQENRLSKGGRLKESGTVLTVRNGASTRVSIALILKMNVLMLVNDMFSPEIKSLAGCI